MYKTMVDVFENSFRLYADRIAFRWRNKDGQFEEMTYREAEEISHALGVGLINLGVKAKSHVGLIADVSHLWTLTDIAIQLIGAVDVPRGTDSTADELAYILNHSGSDVVFVHHAGEIEKIEKGLKKIKKKGKIKIKKFIVMDDEVPKKYARKAIAWSSLIDKGRQIIEKNGKEAKEAQKRRTKVKPEDLSTIIYTSGTTGEPKGVMTMHSNFASQISIVPKIVQFEPDESGLTLLPPWHVFGRITEYLFLSVGASITYTDIKHIGEDLKNIKPTYVPAVPRIWEGVYNKIMQGVRKSGKENIFNFFQKISLAYLAHKNRIENKENLYKKRPIFIDIPLKFVSFIMMLLLLPLKKLGDVLVFKKVLAATGGRMKASISGGGALPEYVDKFFASIGIKILEGYGMTETSPVISVRRPERVVLGTVGPPIPQTEIRLIDLDGNDVTNIVGAKGTLHVRGPQVMKGYYKNPKKTREVLSPDGWMNTGDLVRINIYGEISIVGRSKDTIVLIGGENVEPTPIEEKLKESPYIDHVMCVGQDQKTIGALIVPNEEMLAEFVKKHNIAGESLKDWIQDKQVQALYKSEISRLINLENGFKSFERVTDFRLLTKPFEKGDELNNTLKVKRHVVTEKYKDLIEDMYK
ncbi:MAG: long-chain fatty acid--CoA ligase [Candidatus Hydrogenedentota bacterium]|nr:MAG: long-chain fatty acid--CoA ligase [Candidatus Hydrogenedentota bacterium]